MKNYKLVNNVLGWFAFAISAVVYLMTIEPTASFWDCGEFISSAYKLEVGHPPGNPIFMLTANLFTQLASEPSQVAMMVNAMSAICSALTILFLFWTITHLTRKIVVKDTQKENNISLSQMVTIMGAGMVGALAYTFSDTFWFSAVEGEVYAYSSLFTAVVFWLILKWESVADQPHADRWIVLIAYMMGLSIGVHLLNLLCIPAIVLVYYFKKYPDANLKGTLVALGISFAIVLTLLYGLIQGVVEVCGWFELFFVNVLGMSYNSGVLIYLVLVFGAIIWGLWETVQAKQNDNRLRISFILSILLLGIPFFGDGIWLGILLSIALIVFMFLKKRVPVRLLNISLTCLLVILIGYSSYALIVIRSAANPPMDQNSPEDIFALGSYLNREQYGDRPLIYGQTFASEIKRKSDGQMCVAETRDLGPTWTRIAKENESEKDRYFISERKTRYVYMDELSMLFPRMYSGDPNHVAAYKEWSNFKGTPVKIDVCGQEKVVYKPTFTENLHFFFHYQLNFMYWRYFMWNFSGRQNDIQGHGEITNGNWITGIKVIDTFFVGPQDNMPYDIAENKGHNKYYMLPLLLGLLGLFFQAYSGKKGAQGFWITFLLFFMTGIAIVLYLNQYPFQPRERDYAYAGSFYAFCIWIGLGVPALAKGLQQLKLPALVASGIAATVCLLVPIQMAAENWDDHDRSGRYVCRDVGFNYLRTCEPNAIIFTNGDNDTFPLWYAQEVGGFRTDVRVCNLSYLQTDWYIDQMKLEAYDSPPLPITWKRSEYIKGTNDAAYVYPLLEQPIEVGAALDYAKSTDPRYRKVPGLSEGIGLIPSNMLYYVIDSTSVINGGILPADSSHLISPVMMMDFTNKSHLGKQELMILEMLHKADWQRPIYYASTVGPDQQLGLADKYFRLEGLAYRIVPFDVSETSQQIQTDIMFDNMVNKFTWGGMDDPNVYLDETNVRMARTSRSMFSRLVNALIEEGKNDKALIALDHCQKVIPPQKIRYDYFGLVFADAYNQIGETDKAIDIYEQIMDYYMTNLNWYFRLSNRQFNGVFSSVNNDLRVVQQVLITYQKIKPELVDKYIQEFSIYSRTIEAMTTNLKEKKR